MDPSSPDQAASPVRTRADMSMNMLTGPPQSQHQYYSSQHPLQQSQPHGQYHIHHGYQEQQQNYNRPPEHSPRPDQSQYPAQSHQYQHPQHPQHLQQANTGHSHSAYQSNYYPKGAQNSPTSATPQHQQLSSMHTQQSQQRLHQIPRQNSPQGQGQSQTPSQASSTTYQSTQAPPTLSSPQPLPPVTQSQQPRSSTPNHVTITTPIQSASNQIAPGGAPARQYVNEHVTPHLLEGMKMLVREQPAEPLRVLGEWLIEQNSRIIGNDMA